MFLIQCFHCFINDNKKFQLTEKAGILVRQYVKDNLYDRISTRPFLNSIEKRWIAFQLLQCLSHCHELGVSNPLIIFFKYFFYLIKY